MHWCVINALLAVLTRVLGEGFEEGGEYVNGAVVQIRKRVDRLQLWTAEIPEPSAAVSLGRQFKKKLNIPDGLKVRLTSLSSPRQPVYINRFSVLSSKSRQGIRQIFFSLTNS